jgi:hypothetical protein
VLDVFSSDILLEAQNDTGTWSLATHQRISQARQEDDVSDLDARVLDRICVPDIPIRERFKLAQLCTMVNQKGFPSVSELFARSRDSLTTMLELANHDPLGPAISRLITSLFSETTAKGRHGKRRIPMSQGFQLMSKARTLPMKVATDFPPL